MLKLGRMLLLTSSVSALAIGCVARPEAMVRVTFPIESPACPALDAATKRLTERGSLQFSDPSGRSSDVLLLVQQPAQVWSAKQLQEADRFLKTGRAVVSVGIAAQEGTDQALAEIVFGVAGRAPTGQALPIVAIEPTHPVLLEQGRNFCWRALVGRVEQPTFEARVLAAAGDSPAVWVRETSTSRLVVVHLVPTETLLGDEAFINLLHNSLRWAGGLCDTRHNHLSSSERKAGYELLFDGQSTAGWEMKTGNWQAEQGELRGLNPAGAGAETHRRLELADFVLKLAWCAPPGRAILVVGDRRIALNDPFPSLPPEAIPFPLWHELTLRKTGEQATLLIDGVPVKPPPLPAAPGWIGLGIQEGPPCLLRVRDVRIRPNPGPLEARITGQ